MSIRLTLIHLINVCERLILERPKFIFQERPKGSIDPLVFKSTDEDICFLLVLFVQKLGNSYLERAFVKYSYQIYLNS